MIGFARSSFVYIQLYVEKVKAATVFQWTTHWHLPHLSLIYSCIFDLLPCLWCRFESCNVGWLKPMLCYDSLSIACGRDCIYIWVRGWQRRFALAGTSVIYKLCGPESFWGNWAEQIITALIYECEAQRWQVAVRASETRSGLWWRNCSS